MNDKIEVYPSFKLKYSRRLLLFLIIIFVTLKACSYNTLATYYSFSISMTRSFSKQIINEFDNVEKVKFKFGGGGLSVDYILMNELEADEIDIIFYLTKELLKKEEFKGEFLKKYFSKYRNHQHYPNVSIDFYVDGLSIAKYESEYYPEYKYDEYNKAILRRWE